MQTGRVNVNPGPQVLGASHDVLKRQGNVDAGPAPYFRLHPIGADNHGALDLYSFAQPFGDHASDDAVLQSRPLAEVLTATVAPAWAASSARMQSKTRRSRI